MRIDPRETKKEKPVFMHVYMPNRAVPHLIFGFYSVVIKDMTVFFGFRYASQSVRVL